MRWLRVFLILLCNDEVGAEHLGDFGLTQLLVNLPELFPVILPFQLFLRICNLLGLDPLLLGGSDALLDFISGEVFHAFIDVRIKFVLGLLMTDLVNDVK